MSSRSQIFAPTSSQIERAWHLLTILIRLGRPACPAELASRSALDSIFLSTDLVEFLCRVPGSPISLSRDGFVTISEMAVTALNQFLNQTFRSFVPRVLFRVSEQRRDWSNLRLMYVRKRRVRPLEGGWVGPCAKRRLFWTSERDVEDERRVLQLGIQSSPAKALELHIGIADTVSDGVSSNILSQGIASIPSITDNTSLLLNFEIKNGDHLKRDGESLMCDNAYKMIMGQELPLNLQPIPVQKEMCNSTEARTISKDFLELFGSDCSLDFEQNAIISDADTVGILNVGEPNIVPTSLDKAKNKPVLWTDTLGEDSYILPASPLAVRYEVSPIFLGAEKDKDETSIEAGSLFGHVANHNKNEIATKVRYCEVEGVSFQTDASRREQENSAVKEPSASKLESLMACLSAEPGSALEQQTMSFEKQKVMDGIASTVEFQRSVQESNTRRNDNSSKCEQNKRKENGALMKQKTRRIHILNMPSKENRQETTPKISKINSESRLLPNFESFVIEEEEGSGGYGTVYRARRKEDGKIFAVKCPHPNAHSHHVNNELKMLERFGGRNFVIKYEGSFKSGQSECFVLEHVEHDRPEVLKKEIDVFELQWYGYCMFRALASLHKQGIVHRDVKPGNFLFSRKLNKGYLIDFNLACDLHQKISKSSRSGNTSNANLDPFSLSSTKYKQPGNVRKDRIPGSISREVANDSKKNLLKGMKKRSSKGHIETFPHIDSSNKYGSQAADSGVTSAKDPTSTRTHSVDRLKQMIPYKGRKELINFVHEAMQSPNHKEVTGPASHRKRVAAPLGKINSRLMMLTPMPLHSGGNAVAGAGTFNRGNAKHKREGPCVGTKGFRAPEVLFKSCHQGCKVDVWSAGVTLLYLIIGKTPFGGDPEQNIKEIAKLKGSEDLWEVAKLHNCDSSYPSDLFDVQFLQTTELRDWCLLNNKRPEFLERVPPSLFDLVDKCLTVNPRRRITAEEALMHDFFTPCHESLRKQRQLRRATGLEPGCQSL